MIKLITEHKDYLLLVDTVNSLLKDEVCLELNTLLIKIFQKEEYMKPCVKIIAASHKLGDLPLLPELPQKGVFQKCRFQCGDTIPEKSTCQCYNDFMQESESPKQQEDVEKLAEQKFPETNDPQHEEYIYRDIWVEGYKAASKKWSDEDMVTYNEWVFRNKEWQWVGNGKAYQKDGDKVITHKELFELYKKSLSPTSPIGFEPEYEFLDDDLVPGDSTKVLKIVNGVLQGTYKFKV